MEEVRAELVAMTRDEDWTEYSVKKSGRFYRGYMPDLMSADKTTKTIELSRNGIMQMLPETLFYKEEYLREDITDSDTLKRKKEELKSQRQRCSVFFEGFDTVFAHQEMYLHDRVRVAECERDTIVLRDVYGIDLSRERNPYVRKLALFLLDGDILKGNIPLIAFCIRTILDVKVSYEISTKAFDRSMSSHYKKIRFVLTIEGLSSVEYRNLMEQYEVFFYYVEKWLMPYDCEVDYRIKDYRQRFILGEPLTLDYNTQFLNN